MTGIDILAFFIVGIVIVGVVWELAGVAWETATALVLGCAFVWAFIHVLNFFHTRGAILR